MAQLTGKVVWFNNTKGYGFLSAEGQKDVFCHYTAIQNDGYKTLKEGEPVQFDVVPGDQGLQAANVRRADQLFTAASFGLRTPSQLRRRRHSPHP